jgi:hypothetical protein
MGRRKNEPPKQKAEVIDLYNDSEEEEEEEEQDNPQGSTLAGDVWPPTSPYPTKGELHYNRGLSRMDDFVLNQEDTADWTEHQRSMHWKTLRAKNRKLRAENKEGDGQKRAGAKVDEDYDTDVEEEGNVEEGNRRKKAKAKVDEDYDTDRSKKARAKVDEDNGMTEGDESEGNFCMGEGDGSKRARYKAEEDYVVGEGESTQGNGAKAEEDGSKFVRGEYVDAGPGMFWYWKPQRQRDGSIRMVQGWPDNSPAPTPPLEQPPPPQQRIPLIQNREQFRDLLWRELVPRVESNETDPAGTVPPPLQAILNETGQQPIQLLQNDGRQQLRQFRDLLLRGLDPQEESNPQEEK